MCSRKKNSAHCLFRACSLPLKIHLLEPRLRDAVTTAARGRVYGVLCGRGNFHQDRQNYLSKCKIEVSSDTDSKSANKEVMCASGTGNAREKKG